MRTPELTEFQTQIPAALESLGLTINPDTLDIRNHSRFSIAVAETVDASFVVAIDSWKNHGDLDSDRHHTDRTRPENAWGGLIRHTVDRLNIEYSPYPDYPSSKISTTVNAAVLSSPKSYNDAQRALGRRPGIDALEFRYTADSRHLEGGYYTEFFANKAAPVCRLDASEWFQTEHDLHPTYHATDWVCKDPWLINATANRSAGLLETYGAQAYEENPEDRPKEIKFFNQGIDSAFVPFTNLLRLVYLAGNEEKQVSRKRDDATSFDATPYLTILHGIVDAKIRTFAPVRQTALEGALHNMGIIDLHNDPAAYKISAAITARTISHIAGMLIISNEVTPPELNPTDVKLRQDRLRLIQKQFAIKLAKT